MVRWFRRLKRSLRQLKEAKQQAKRKRAEDFELWKMQVELLNNAQQDRLMLAKGFARAVREGAMDIREVPYQYQEAVGTMLKEEKEEGEAG